MKLIVALGNPGPEYLWTRHNFGFLALDFYFKKKDYEWNASEKYHALWKKQGDVIFIKPQTFYNEVGTSVRAFADFYKIPPEDILILCDDFNLPFGTLRLREKGSAGGNNGLKSVISHLGTENFPRLRLGTGNDEVRKTLGDVDFVLGHFTSEEKSALKISLTSVTDTLDSWIFR